MAKKRSMNELRQTKDAHYVNPTFNPGNYEDCTGDVKTGTSAADTQVIAADGVPLGNRRGYSEIDIETTKDLIFNQLKNQLFDIMFQAVNDEMAKHEVFQAETYFTPQGEEWFEDTWFEFYHEHHGDILSSIMKDFTN